MASRTIWLFEDRHGRRVDLREIARACRRAAKAAGLRPGALGLRMDQALRAVVLGSDDVHPDGVVAISVCHPQGWQDWIEMCLLLNDDLDHGEVCDGDEPWGDDPTTPFRFWESDSFVPALTVSGAVQWLLEWRLERWGGDAFAREQA